MDTSKENEQERENEQGGIKESPEVSNQDFSQTPSLTWKEMKALKKSRYHEIFDKFDHSYVLKNKRTGQIVEIRAASSFHACNIIGWRKNKVVILEEKIIGKVNESNVSSSINENKIGQ